MSEEVERIIEEVKNILKEVDKLVPNDDTDRKRLINEAIESKYKYEISVIIIKLLRRSTEQEIVKLLIKAHLLLP